MAKQFSLQPLLELMQQRADDATRNLGKLIAAEQDAQARLQLLQQYRAEYSLKMQQAAQAGITPHEWRNYQDFLGRIDEAITQQTNNVNDSRQRTADGQAHWLEQRNRLKAIDTLSDRHAAAQQTLLNKQEQKQSDEFAARRNGPPKQ